MLLTKLLSLNFKVDDVECSFNSTIHRALDVIFNNTASDQPETFINEYPQEPLSQERLYITLSRLIGTTENPASVTESRVLTALGSPDPFLNFDDILWASLHIACAQCPERPSLVYQKIYTWLRAADSKSYNAMQARLFLMSRPNFDLERAGAEIIAQPILAANDYWAWLALLSRPGFKVEDYDHSAIDSKISDVLEQLWTFVKLSGLDAGEITALLNNIVALKINDTILNQASNASLKTLLNISSSVSVIEENVMAFLTQIGAKFIKEWNLNLTEGQEEEINKPLNKFNTLIEHIHAKIKSHEGVSIEEVIAENFQNEFSRLRNVGIRLIDRNWDPWTDSMPRESLLDQIRQVWEKVTKDPASIQRLYNDGRDESRQKMRKGRAEALLRDFLNLITVPGMLDILLSSADKEVLALKINESLDLASEVFFSIFFNGIWDKNYYQSQAFSDVAMDWLLDFEAFKRLQFITHPDGVKYLDAIFTANNAHFIQELFRLNREHGKRFHGHHFQYPIFTVMTQRLSSYNEAMQRGVAYLLADADFSIAMYYEQSNEAFKKLPQVRNAKLLSDIFSSDSSLESLKSMKISSVKHADIFIHELTHRYLGKIHELAMQSVELKEDQVKIEFYRMKNIHNLMKRLPAADKNTLRQDPIFIQFDFQYRMDNNKNLQNKEGATGFARSAKQVGKGFLKSIGASTKTVGKDEKNAFLQYIKDEVWELTRDKSGEEFKQDGSAFFMKRVYCALHELSPTYASTISMETVNNWLLKTMLHSSSTKGSMTARTLACVLSDELFEQIFADTYITMQTLCEKAGLKMSSFSHASRAAAIDDEERTSDENEDETPLSNHGMFNSAGANSDVPKETTLSFSI
jgi:hypothetical protein